MQENKPLIAILIGALSTIPHEIITRILVSLDIGKYTVYQLSSLIVTVNRPTALLGFVLSSLVGSSAGLVFYYVVQRISSDYLIIKGFVAGLIAWVVTEVFFTWLIEGPNKVPPRPISDYYLELIGSVIFGLTMGYLFKKYLALDRTRV